MEILNNLWLAVSTPNETLINIIAIPCAVIENILIMLLFVSILDITSSRKQKLLYVILMTIVSLLSMYIIPNPFNVFFNFGMMIGLAYIIFKMSFLKSTASILTSAIGFNIINFIILNPYITLLNIDTKILSTVPAYRILYILIIYLFVLSLIFIIKHRNFRLNFLENMDKKSKFIIFSNLILGLLTIILQCITLFYYVDKLPIIITFSNAICLVLYFAINIYSLTRIFKLILTTRKLQSAEEYNHSLRVLHDSVRAFKHDFDNMVTTIGGYIKTNDMEGLEKYYTELVDDSERVNNLYILNPEVVNNDGIYNLLTKKYHEADSKDIKVNITFLLDLSTLNMKIYEFARILGILLDNAIEASSECEEKVVNLIFRDDRKNHTQLIIVENTYADKTVDTEKIFEKGISGKENHTGLGLWKVRKIVNKNSNVVLRTIKDDKFFKQQLEIYYK